MIVTDSTMDAPITFTISAAAAEAIDLDERLTGWASDHPNLRVRHDAGEATAEYRRRGRGGSVTVMCSPRIALLVLTELADRADASRFDWDQPKSWKAACVTAHKVVRQAVPA